MPKPNPFLDYTKAKLRGGNPASPPGEPVNRDKAMAAGISAQLKGNQAPRDITGDPTSSPYSGASDPLGPGDQTDTISAKDEAYQAMEPDLQAACANASDPNHDVAMRVWKAETQWLEIQRKRAQP
jgi:hypothetical protein